MTRASRRSPHVHLAHRRQFVDQPVICLSLDLIEPSHSLRLKAIAEGVETEEQKGILRRLDCDELQGYIFSPPLSPEELGARLDAMRKT